MICVCRDRTKNKRTHWRLKSLIRVKAVSDDKADPVSGCGVYVCVVFMHALHL